MSLTDITCPRYGPHPRPPLPKGWKRGSAKAGLISTSGFGHTGAALADLPSGTEAFGPLRGFYDAGVGVSAAHRIGTTSFVTRFDFPLFVSEAGLAQDDDPSDAVGFRWLFSFVPAM